MADSDHELPLPDESVPGSRGSAYAKVETELKRLSDAAARYASPEVSQALRGMNTLSRVSRQMDGLNSIICQASKAASQIARQITGLNSFTRAAEDAASQTSRLLRDAGVGSQIARQMAGLDSTARTFSQVNGLTARTQAHNAYTAGMLQAMGPALSCRSQIQESLATWQGFHGVLAKARDALALGVAQERAVLDDEWELEDVPPRVGRWPHLSWTAADAIDRRTVHPGQSRIDRRWDACSTVGPDGGFAGEALATKSWLVDDPSGESSRGLATGDLPSLLILAGYRQVLRDLFALSFVASKLAKSIVLLLRRHLARAHEIVPAGADTVVFGLLIIAACLRYGRRQDEPAHLSLLDHRFLESAGRVSAAC